MKTIDEREIQRTKKEKQLKAERSKETNYSERVRTKWFCSAFKLAFPQLICKASLIFKSNLELSIINNFKTKRIIWDKACFGVV